MTKQETIICIGEVLWDALPGGIFLGGAPLNACYHLNRMGIPVEVISRVGDDQLGLEAVRRIRQKNINTGLIQIDRELPTGFVTVELDEAGNPLYEIIEPVAWDNIRISDIPEDSLNKAWGLIFGSLAQRNKISRRTIWYLLNSDIIKILDLNLRPPYNDRQVVKASLQVADIVKMNTEELETVCQWFSLSGEPRGAVEELAKRFSCPTVCITRGEKGSALFHEGIWTEHPGYRITVKDAVGAGDAFLAALIYGIRNGKKGTGLLELANSAGAFVSQKDGAMPDYSIEEIFSPFDKDFPSG